MTDIHDDAAGLGPDDIRRVLEALEASDWDQAQITVGDVRIAVARNGSALPGTTTPDPPPATGSAPAVADATVPASPPPKSAPAPPPSSSAPDGTEVTSPSVGVFWRSPEPGAAPFVEVGARVAVGDTLGIVEVMKLMSHVDAPVAGTVTAIHAENAQPVEHGAALFTIDPDGS